MILPLPPISRNDTKVNFKKKVTSYFLTEIPKYNSKNLYKKYHSALNHEKLTKGNFRRILAQNDAQ